MPPSSQRYPAAALKPPVPLKRVQVCSVSGALATGGCEHAGTSYAAELPASCLPRDPCQIHRGGALSPTDSSDDRGQKTERHPALFPALLRRRVA